MKVVHELVAAKPSTTTGELALSYNRAVPKSRRAHRSSILRALHRAGYVFKKNGLVLLNRTGPTSP
jgi:hypothetical protein